MGLNIDPLALSVAGRNNRYNNVQIDGAVNNDVFGLAPSGTPGGVTEAQPISLDAIQELQLVVSPYDVRQGGFSGGGINAITKSGSNQFRGTAYYFGRNEDWVGESPTGAKIGPFKDQQFGGSVGGPHGAEQGVLLRQHRLGSSRQPVGHLGERHRSTVWPRRRNRPVPQHPAEPLRLRSGDAGRVRADDQQRQDFRPYRFQHRAKPSARRSPQLPRCAERHRASGSVQLLHAGLLLPVHGQDELQCRAIEQHHGVVGE